MFTNDNRLLVACSEGARELCILQSMANRHGLIAGATGTGKTISIQTLAESFSSAGVPVFLADIKGDLSGLARKGSIHGKTEERVKKFDLLAKGYSSTAFPVQFWDVYGQSGTPMRTTISEMGPLLLSRVLGLNEVQEGVLRVVFRIADDKGYLLLDLKDLKSMLQYVSEERNMFKTEYGQISTSSVGAIQRSILHLEEEGGDSFFCEPALEIDDLLGRDDRGFGIINILAAERLINAPKLYSCVMLWILSELFEKLPEAGDTGKPRIVFFFDEAHLLFDIASPVLLAKIEQVVRLIRSKGVGIYFASQSPADIPDAVLGQLGNRIQHAMRAYSPKDKKAVRIAADTFRQNPDFSTEKAISELGIGEALVSFLDKQGIPDMVEKGFIVPPQSMIGAMPGEERNIMVAQSPMQKKYGSSFDRISAYENLAEQAARDVSGAKIEPQTKSTGGATINDILGSVLKQTTRTVGATVGREIGKTLVRGLLGSLLGIKK